MEWECTEERWPIIDTVTMFWITNGSGLVILTEITMSRQHLIWASLENYNKEDPGNIIGPRVLFDYKWILIANMCVGNRKLHKA